MFDFKRLRDALTESGGEHFLTEGFIIGLALGLLLVLIVWLIVILLRGRSKSKAVTIPGENGDLIVTVNAIRQFVTRILSDFPNASLRSVDLFEKRIGLIFRISVDAAPEADLIELRDTISSQIMEEAGKRIGLTALLKKVDVTVHSYEIENRSGSSSEDIEPDFLPEEH